MKGIILMTSSKLVSVIVPVYNSEAHISACLNSIIQQSYENLEIIIVNDASTDSSRTIAEKLLASNGRKFQIIDHEKNRGVSAARNTGLDASHGEYVWFCDSDDIAENNLVSELSGFLTTYDSDISFCGIINRFEDGRPDEIDKVRVNASLPLSGENALYMRMLKPIAPHTCAIMFRKSMLTENNIRFHDGCKAFEDIEFQMKAFCHAERVSFTTECLYIYVHSAEMGSVRDNNTYAKSLRRYIDSSEAHYRTAEYLSCNAPSERTKFLADYLLMPEAVIRKFTVCARANDHEGFYLLLENNEIRKILLSSRKVFFMKPELFMKALVILFLPGLYFRMRRKK